jgi:hypothetical protein
MVHFMGGTPSAEYQYAEAAERLYNDTGDERFRQVGLKWCRFVQRAMPWTSWAYTFEVSLTPDPTTRRRSLVKALFLDPQSPRLKSIPADELKSARAQLENNNPFQTRGQVPDKVKSRNAI